jgi:hypothetical protein
VATDNCGNADTCATTVTVIDTTPPKIKVVLSRDVLWPPNDRLVTVLASVEITDTCDPNPTFVLTSITSDQSGSGLLDGARLRNIQGAAFGTPDVEFQLRSEHSNVGDGRVYRVAYTASDVSGNAADGTVDVSVPHDQRGAALASLGFTPAGTFLDPAAPRFALVLPSVATAKLSEIPSFDAAQVPETKVYVGNTAGAIRPEERRVEDVNRDGLRDVVFFFLASGANEIAARSDAVDGPLGMHYEGGNAQTYIVPDIFALGAPTSLDGYSSRPAAEEVAVVGHPEETVFGGAYPNPFGPSVRLAFTLKQEENVSVTVYDSRGAQVRSIVSGFRRPGWYEVVWDGDDESGRALASGVYFVLLKAGEYQSTRKAILLK